MAYNNRVLVLGMTGSGKSEHLNHLFSAIGVQRLLLDTKEEWSVAGVEPVSSPAAIDWRQPIIHYVPASVELEEMERLFAACWERRGRRLVVAAHELGDLCKFTPAATPSAVLRYINQGRAHGLGLLGASQRPVSIPVHARTEAEHVFVFVPELGPDDHKTVAATLGIDRRALSSTLARTLESLGAHSFLWFNRRTRALMPCRPLPDHVRKRSVVRSRAIA